MKEIARCKFCGKLPAADVVTTLFYPPKVRGFAIMCWDCKLDNYVEAATEDEAVEIWNRKQHK